MGEEKMKVRGRERRKEDIYFKFYIRAHVLICSGDYNKIA